MRNAVTATALQVVASDPPIIRYNETLLHGMVTCPRAAFGGGLEMHIPRQQQEMRQGLTVAYSMLCTETAACFRVALRAAKERKLPMT